MQKVKLIRDFGNKKKGSVVEVTEQQAYFLLTNAMAVVTDCGSDCEECEDCKGKTKKKAPAKKTVRKTKTATKK